MEAVVSLIAVGQLKGQTAPYRLETITGTVYDSAGTALTIPSPKSLVFFRGKTFMSPENQGIVTTLAGSGAATFSDGTGTGASFNFEVGGPTIGVAVDTNGTVYVADYKNGKIRKITSGGVVTTLAGTDGGVISRPTGVAVDANLNVYVADATNLKIYKITSGGVVTTLAGSTQGFNDGQGESASFNYPHGIAVDANMNVYVADAANNSIRKVTSEGVVSTLAGSSSPGFSNGTGADASFDRPTGVAVDANGNVFVADRGNNLIRKITPEGVVSTLAGTGSNSIFRNPYDVAVDAYGNVFVTDEQNQRIRKVTSGGVVTTLAGSGSPAFADGTGTTASFSYPKGVGVNRAGVLYVADAGNHRIRKIS